MKDKLDFDASKLFEALKYQIHVAIEYCHTLSKNDVLWIEVFGDVTIEGRDQIEVKNYSDKLYDSHLNLWNTINNWLKPEFRHQNYTNLILLTTQAYSEHTSLKSWGDSDTAERFDILDKIYTAGVARFEKAEKAKKATIVAGCITMQTVQDEPEDDLIKLRDEKKKRKNATPSESLKLQHKVMAPEVRVSLLEALPKIKIITEQPSLLDLISSYKNRYLLNIMPHRQDEFINDLFGFMTGAAKITEGWRITKKEFEKIYTELTVRYINGTLKFPRLNSEELKMELSSENVRSRPFARKLDEIGGDEDLIREASVDLLHAEKYIMELVKDVATSQDDIQEYSNNQLRIHRSSRASAMYKCAKELTADDLKNESCIFYSDRCATSVDRFSTYVSTPIEFRNGIYHMLADQEPANPMSEFHWRLWK